MNSVRSLLLCALLLMAGQSFAQDWVAVNGLALHLNGERHCNNYFTPGMGVEKGLSRDWSAALGVYDNSNCRTSLYASLAYMPLHMGPVRAGAIGGVVTGYSMAVMPAGGLAVSYEEKKWGVNLIYIPPYGSSGNVAWFQVKVPW